MFKTKFRPRVARGAKLLDSYDPDWFRKINVGDLSMGDTNVCVLGQMFIGELRKIRKNADKYVSPYEYGMKQLDIYEKTELISVQHGFSQHEYMLGDDLLKEARVWSELAECWVVEIKKRYEHSLIPAIDDD